MDAQQKNPATSSSGYQTGIADGNLAKPVRLRDFLFGVGVVFQLPKKKKAKPAAPDAKNVATKGLLSAVSPRTVLLGAGAVAVAVVAVLLYQQFRNEGLPREVAGTWTTNDGRYAGRNFWINAKAVAFQTGKKTDQFTQHNITKVHSQKTPSGTIYNIDYDEDGHSVTFAINFTAEPRPTVRLVNQPTVTWYRTGDAPVMIQ